MLAYHNEQSVKSAILAQLAMHRKADELVQGYGYWHDGKGCAVGCTLYSSDHAEYESRFGIPQMLARLEDCIFEGLPVKQARKWPERLMKAVPVGADLSRVGWKFIHWILTDETVNPGIGNPIVTKSVSEVAGLIFDLSEGLSVSAGSARSAASAARSAAGSARSAAESAAWSAARSAESAAWSAAIAALSAARSAENAARSAAWSAERAAYVKMADKLIELIKAAT